MANTYKPIEETTFVDNKPIPGAMLKQVYDNIEQVDENQRKMQVNKVWNAGRTSFTNTDPDSETLPNNGTIIAPGDIVGYRVPDNTATDYDSRFLKVIPTDLYGCVIPVPFYKTKTSNKIQIAVSCQVVNSPVFMSTGYTLELDQDGTLTNYSPVIPLTYNLDSTYTYSSNFYNDATNSFSYDQIDPRDYNSSYGNTDPIQKYISTSSTSRLITFEHDVDLNSSGPSVAYLNMCPTWLNIAIFSDLGFTLYTDSLGKTEVNIVKIQDVNVISYRSIDLLPSAGSRTGNKVGFGVEIYHATDSSKKFYYSIIEYLPGLDTSTDLWDVDDLDLMIYPRLNEEIIATPSDYRINLYLSSEVNIFAINVRELYVP